MPSIADSIRLQRHAVGHGCEIFFKGLARFPAFASDRKNSVVSTTDSFSLEHDAHWFWLLVFTHNGTLCKVESVARHFFRTYA